MTSVKGPALVRKKPLTDQEYSDLLTFRTELRRFLAWSADQAKAAGVTPAQHQLILAVRGFRGRSALPTVGDLANVLMSTHHATVELIDRAEKAGWVTRRPDDDDSRVVRVALTRNGADLLDLLSAAHLEELARLASMLAHLVPMHVIGPAKEAT
jgi:DNA-binding MarR family transcriptional regulator